MKIVLHIPSQKIYPYNSQSPCYLKGMGKYSKEVLEERNMFFIKFYLMFLYQEWIIKKRLHYKLANLFNNKIRLKLYNYI